MESATGLVAVIIQPDLEIAMCEVHDGEGMLLPGACTNVSVQVTVLPVTIPMPVMPVMLLSIPKQDIYMAVRITLCGVIMLVTITAILACIASYLGIR